MGHDEEVNKQLISQEVLAMFDRIQGFITELKEQVTKKDIEAIQAIMQTSLDNAQKEETTETIMMKMLLLELIKNPKSFENLMQITEIANKSKNEEGFIGFTYFLSLKDNIINLW